MLNRASGVENESMFIIGVSVVPSAKVRDCYHIYIRWRRESRPLMTTSIPGQAMKSLIVGLKL